MARWVRASSGWSRSDESSHGHGGSSETWAEKGGQDGYACARRYAGTSRWESTGATGQGQDSWAWRGAWSSSGGGDWKDSGRDWGPVREASASTNNVGYAHAVASGAASKGSVAEGHGDAGAGVGAGAADSAGPHQRRLNPEDCAMFDRLATSVFEEQQAGGQRTLRSILNALSRMTLEDKERCVALGNLLFSNGGGGGAEAVAAKYCEYCKIYCKYCEMWLNGPIQFKDHKVGKKHKQNVRKAQKNVRRARAIKTASTSAAPGPKKPKPALAKAAVVSTSSQNEASPPSKAASAGSAVLGVDAMRMPYPGGMMSSLWPYNVYGNGWDSSSWQQDNSEIQTPASTTELPQPLYQHQSIQTPASINVQRPLDSYHAYQ